MIGVCDSGEGGVVAVEELRAISPTVDVCFFADRKNAPYGTKSPDELLSLLRADINRVRDAGADEVLIACCTASTVYCRLTEEERRGVYPIIAPTAKAALEKTKNGCIGVLATEATVLSHAFAREIKRNEPNARVIELSGIISEYAGSITVISSAREGALEIAKHARLAGAGATTYL